MARPDYIVCLECHTEVDDFTWRGGEIRRASCDVCGNEDPDAFALAEEIDQDFDAEDELDELDELDDEDDDEEYADDYEGDLE